MIRSAPKRFLRKMMRKYVVPDFQFTYSQFGEDAIIAFLFYQLGISKPTYLDIGANEPRLISNTYYFYEHGSRGVLIEPNPYLFKKLKSIRKHDVVLNTGIGFDGSTEADFYIFPDFASGLNTFSKKEAMHWAEVGAKGMGKIPIKEVIKLPLIPINDVMVKYFPDKAPNIISVDVEGLDLEIIKGIDFSKYKPEVLCVETMEYDENQESYKNYAVQEFLLGKGYEVYADTRVNTIFARKDIFKK
jgi:FkbM family methyltransferase